MKTKVATKREIYEWIRAHHTQALDDIQCWEIAKWHVDRPGKETRAQLIERFERLDPPYNMPPARRRRWSHDARRQVYDRQAAAAATATALSRPMARTSRHMRTGVIWKKTPCGKSIISLASRIITTPSSTTWCR